MNFEATLTLVVDGDVGRQPAEDLVLSMALPSRDGLIHADGITWTDVGYAMGIDCLHELFDQPSALLLRGEVRGRVSSCDRLADENARQEGIKDHS